MTKKSDLVTRLLDRVSLPQGVPAPPKGSTLLEQGMVLALLEHLPAARAEAVVETLRKAYADWNEARVAQAQELSGHLAGRGLKTPDRTGKNIPVANAIRNYLQEVFQRTHGLDLEFLRADPVGAAKVVTALPMLGNYLGSVLLWMASGGDQPVTSAVMRVLDRLKLLARTTSLKKAREAMEPLIPNDQALRFAAGFGYVADRWCDARKPVCWECVLVEECATGRKVLKDWKVQQERQAVSRAREEAKRSALEKKDAARREREAERARKREEVARQKAERERERKAKREAEAGQKAPKPVASAKAARPSGKSSSPAATAAAKPSGAKPETHHKPKPSGSKKTEAAKSGARAAEGASGGAPSAPGKSSSRSKGAAVPTPSSKASAPKPTPPKSSSGKSGSGKGSSGKSSPRSSGSARRR